MEYIRRFLLKHPTIATAVRLAYSTLRFFIDTATLLYPHVAAGLTSVVAVCRWACDVGHRLLCALSAVMAAWDRQIAARHASTWLSSLVKRLHDLGVPSDSVDKDSLAVPSLGSACTHLFEIFKTICRMYVHSRGWVKVWSVFWALMTAYEVGKIFGTRYTYEQAVPSTSSLARGWTTQADKRLLPLHPDAVPVLTVCVPMSALSFHTATHSAEGAVHTFARLGLGYARRQNTRASYAVEGVSFATPDPFPRSALLPFLQRRQIKSVDTFYCANAILPWQDEMLPAAYPAPVVTACFPLFLPLPLQKGGAAVGPTWNVTFTHHRKEEIGHGSYLDVERRARCVDFLAWPAHEWDLLAVREGVELGPSVL